MEKIERFLRDSWLLRLGIGILWIIWATGIGGYIVDNRSKIWNDMKPEPINSEKLMKSSAEFSVFKEKVLKEAEEKGDAYSPKDYFVDLKSMDEEQYRLEKKYSVKMIFAPSTSVVGSPIPKLQERLNKNIFSGKFNSHEIEIQSEKYVAWKKDGTPEVQEDREKIMARGWKKNLISFLQWFFSFYFCSLPLVFILYLMRMSDRKGILQTILADKKRFVYSIFAWPLAVWKYPFNVIKEILVETELRRMGKLFRKLTRSERKKIIHVAENFSFRVWVKAFRQRNASKLQHAFLTALIVTVFMHFALPVASAQNKNKKNNSYQQQMQEAKGEHQKNDKSPPHPDLGSHDDAEFAPPYIPEEPEVNRLVLQKSVAHKKERLDKIMHVPCAGCLVKNTKQPELLSFLRHRRESWTWKRLYKKLYKKLLQSSLSATSNMRFYPTCRLKNHRWLKIYS